MEIYSKSVNSSTNPISESSADETVSQRGWALKATKKNTRIAENVRAFLVEKFDAGERSGRKADPAEVERELKFAKDESGLSLFKSAEWLTAKQIKSFFSRHAAKLRKKSSQQYPEEAFMWPTLKRAKLRRNIFFSAQLFIKLLMHGR